VVVPTARAKLKRSRLIDEHDWNVVAHSVAKPALVTKKRLLLLTILELTLTLRADEDFQ
jgi:hypothetical protein